MRLATGVAHFVYAAAICALLAACAQQEGPTVTATVATGDDGGARPTATTVVIPTLYPTNTPSASPAATASVTPAPSPSPQSTIDFEEPVIQFRYQIPALGLDRRLEANVAGRITVVDETLGVAAIRENQGGVSLELQQALPELQLPPLPANCETCVAFAYDMPLEGLSAQGWLTDTVMLASVENYTSLLLGPHFPPGTQLGLRRSATAYDVAHSLALTGEGQLWRWLATEPDVAQALPAADVDAGLSTVLDDVALDAVADEYRVACPGTPVETLYLNPDGAAPADDAGAVTSITITCPAFSLPSTLLPLYLRLDALMDPLLAGQGRPRPPLEIPLATMLDYQREDGTRLTLAVDGAARAITAQETVITDTVAATEVLSFTRRLLETEALAAGINAYVSEEAANILLVRGPQGLAELDWDGSSSPDPVAEEVALLDELLDQLLEEARDGAAPEPSPTATPAATPAP